VIERLVSILFNGKLRSNIVVVLMPMEERQKLDINFGEVTAYTTFAELTPALRNTYY
jgi:hypothetical protein